MERVDGGRLVLGSRQVYEGKKVLALLPVLGGMAVLFGPEGLLPTAAAIVGSLGADLLMARLFSRRVRPSWDAVGLGLLVGLFLPPGLHPVAGFLAAVFGQVVARWTFGGPARAWFHPAVAAVLFAVVSFPFDAGSYLPPLFGDRVQGLPLFVEAKRLLSGLRGGSVLQMVGLTPSGIDVRVTGVLNDVIFVPLRSYLPDGYVDLALGNVPGAVGAQMGLFVFLGALILVYEEAVRVDLPFLFLGAYTLLVFVAGGGPEGGADVLFYLGATDVVLTAFFLVPDEVSRPSRAGLLPWYAVAGGLLAGLFSLGGAFPYPGLLCAAVLNLTVPLVDHLSVARVGGRA
ncbi:hypothetical protein Spith_0461 [Spirochaeta thermophila DSM 6578]|uniref:Uncharacterized protein n=1 Tax=Winmispira thermophila (strain ATCC 700085 / DSM 6578 / Z-1203) TaxID=869211 RepID=G0GF44_WINT7|nr:RnfABCDGE type electron transport complex subunit D [Spirochaeta thermophila]AEJ60743.1 hypothetical protein Spith_0461 [Spirochaeta thermophila DSM 6578]